MVDVSAEREAQCLQLLLVRSVKNFRLPTYEYKPFVWRRIGPVDPESGPGPRSGHRMIYHDGGLLIYGGFNPRTEIKEFREVWHYSVGREEWTRKNIKGRVTRNVASHAATVINDNASATSPFAKLLVYGGTSHPFGQVKSTKLYVCDLRTFDWEVVKVRKPDGSSFSEDSRSDASDEDRERASAATDKPCALYGQAIAVLKDASGVPVLYTFGGTDGIDYWMDVDSFNFKTLRWTKLYKSDLRSDPMPRYRHEICSHDDKIFVFGGGTTFVVYDLVEIWCFDTRSKHPKKGAGGWTKITTFPDLSVPRSAAGNEQFPAPRRCHEVVKHDKYAYLFGGFDAERAMDDTWRLDLETFQWKLLPRALIEPVYFSSSAISPGGQVFQMGGVRNVETMERTNKLHSMWVGVASLRDMAWDAVLHYLPSISKLGDATLKAGGIPVDLIKSLKSSYP